MKNINIIIKGNPLAKQSARFSKRGFSYQPKHITQYKENLQHQIISQLPFGFTPIDNAVEIEYRFIFSYLKTHSKKKRADGYIMKTTKPDIDNLQKAVNDAMNSIVIIDDSLICRAIVEKVYGEVPSIELTIRSIE